MAKLKEDFPGLAELAAVDITTEAQLRKARESEDWPDQVPGIGPATSEKIDVALAALEAESLMDDGDANTSLEKDDATAEEIKDITPPPPVRKLLAGTILPFGDKRLVLGEDVSVTFENGNLDDGGFAGLLAVSGPENFKLNIGQLAPKRYSPATGAYVPNECDNCGAVIPGDDEAADCPDCVTKKAAEAEA